MFKEKSALPAISLFCICLIIICLFIIPLRILAQGYLPIDDCLRHAAKVISGNNWDKILVLSDKFKMDTHPGWHSILGFIHNLTNCNQLGLVVFSVVMLFLIASFIPLIFLELPEIWLFTLLIISTLDASFIRRLLFGRPYLFTMSVLFCLCFLWPKLKEQKLNYRVFFSLIALIALSIWIHGAWYLFILPIICFFLVGEYQVGLRLIYATGIGIFLGATLSRHPFIFLWQNINQAFLVFGKNIPKDYLAYEFQPIKIGISKVLFILSILFLGYTRKAWNFKKIYNPVFLLAILGWFLGFITRRFWWEWGAPALCVWMAQEFQIIFKKIFGRFSLSQFALSRLIITLTLAIVIYFNFTSNLGYHWIDKITISYSDFNKTEYRKLLPEPGGIIYSDGMTVFYETFFRYPHAQWRYMVGFEPAWMPARDLKIFRDIQKSHSASAYIPWIKKMKKEDRLIITRDTDKPPEAPGLEWHYIPQIIWIGKLSRK